MKTRIYAIPIGFVVLSLVILQASVADNVRGGSTIVYQASGRVGLPMVNDNMGGSGGRGIHGPIFFGSHQNTLYDQPWQADVWSSLGDNANMLAGAEFNSTLNEFAMVNSEFGLIDRPTMVSGITSLNDNALVSDIGRQRPWDELDPQTAANWQLDK